MFPIVLIHGIARFDELLKIIRERLELPNDWTDGLDYFKNIKCFLEANGCAPVFHASLDFAGSVEFRAQQLAEQIGEFVCFLNGQKVHLIAHSMGGLDARHAIVDFGIANKVAGLTTIGTPHFGTVLADEMLNQGGKILVDILAPFLDLRGFEDLTITACTEFNQRAESIESANEVLYHTYASAEEPEQTFSPLIASNLLLSRLAGPNDGLVPVSSQLWKSELLADDRSTKHVVQRCFPFPADHLNQTGWWDPSELVDRVPYRHLSDAKSTYENRVKNVYLAIARNLEADNIAI